MHFPVSLAGPMFVNIQGGPVSPCLVTSHDPTVLSLCIFPASSCGPKFLSGEATCTLASPAKPGSKPDVHGYLWSLVHCSTSAMPACLAGSVGRWPCTSCHWGPRCRLSFVRPAPPRASSSGSDPSDNRLIVSLRDSILSTTPNVTR